ncbi:hypothetical protein AB0B60_28110 [Streptomyces lincolnensis]|nr:hypothetical protein [Streptomyces lincolnensis]
MEADAVRDVTAAWAAFGEFLQIDVDGIEPPQDDGDGFIAEWGRWSWNDDQPALSFRRRLAVTGAGELGDPDCQPEYWAVELLLVFAEDPAWADLDSLGHQNTGFDFTAIGAARTAALGDARRFMASYPQLVAMWRAEPLRSELNLEQVA